MDKRAVAVIVKDGSTLLIRRIKNGQEYFVFPGGGVKKEETIEEALIREIKEELCIDIKIKQPLFDIKNEGRQELYFLVTEFSGEPTLGTEEKDRIAKNNRYFPEWKNSSEIKNLSNLYPQSAKQKVEEMIGGNKGAML